MHAPAGVERTFGGQFRIEHAEHTTVWARGLTSSIRMYVSIMRPGTLASGRMRANSSLFTAHWLRSPMLIVLRGSRGSSVDHSSRLVMNCFIPAFVRLLQHWQKIDVYRDALDWQRGGVDCCTEQTMLPDSALRPQASWARVGVHNYRLQDSSSSILRAPPRGYHA